MISREQALEAERVFKWCAELEGSEAFAAVFAGELAAREAEHDRCGLDISKKPRVRCEHHRALLLARDMIGLVPRRKAEALDTLRQWKAQNGEGFAPMADERNV